MGGKAHRVKAQPSRTREIVAVAGQDLVAAEQPVDIPREDHPRRHPHGQAAQPVATAS